MTNIIQARHLNKFYGKQQVLNNINLQVNPGEIVGIVGVNGAGKSTLLKSLLGLTRVSGDLNVCGLNPRQAQDKLMQTVSFIADTATLPKWITAAQLFDYSEAVHPKFNRNLAEQFLENTEIKPNMRVKKMSKGMITQLHLALVIAIESDLLVLDEPTLGLDIIRRKAFYNSLLEDYFDHNNTILITTHQIEEIEHILTRVIFIDNGLIVLDEQIENLENRFIQLETLPEYQTQVEQLKPIYSQKTLSGHRYIFDGQDSQTLSQFGKINTPELADLFVAMLSPKTATEHREAC